MSNKWGKLIVSLDIVDEKKINDVINTLSPKGVKFKIGTIPFTKFGPQFVKGLIDKGADVFLDLKLHDIPNTMASTAKSITEMNCWSFTVHLKAGEKALTQVKSVVEKTSQEKNLRKPLVLGVSVLTSEKAQENEVMSLISLADKVGIDGVIASAYEAKAIKKTFPKLTVITPGIRGPKDTQGDQVRVMTANQAFENGADYIVVGRPIIEKEDYFKAAQEILES